MTSTTLGTKANDRGRRPTAGLRHRLRAVPWGVLVVVALALPFFVDRLTLVSFGDVAVLAVVVMSSNLLTGVTGQISLAQGAFFGAGAYTTGMFVTNLGWSLWAALPVVILMSAAIGALTSLPALRIAGLHLALVTLGVALVFPTLILRLGPSAGGPSGISLPEVLDKPTWFPFTQPAWVYWVLVIVMFVVLLLVRNLFKSRPGRAMFAIRDRPILASALGTNVRLAKVFAFTGAAAIAGIAGWMFAVQNQFVSPADFGVFLSLNILLAMTLGGAGTIAGPIFGAIFLRFVPDVGQELGIPPILSPAVTGVLIILVLLFLPRGIAGIGQPIARLFSRFVGQRDRRPPVVP